MLLKDNAKRFSSTFFSPISKRVIGAHGRGLDLLIWKNYILLKYFYLLDGFSYNMIKEVDKIRINGLIWSTRRKAFHPQ